jgi:hypothetical protein
MAHDISCVPWSALGSGSVGDRRSDNRMTLPSVALPVSSWSAYKLEDYSLSIFTVVDEGDTVSVLGKVGILVSADLEPGGQLYISKEIHCS